MTVHALLDTPLPLAHGPNGYRHPWSAILFCIVRGVPRGKGGRPYRTSTMPDAEWEMPRSWKRRGRGRHESIEYDRKANIPFVPANVLLPRVILCCRKGGRANDHGRPQCLTYYLLNVYGGNQKLSVYPIPTPYRFTGRAGTRI